MLCKGVLEMYQKKAWAAFLLWMLGFVGLMGLHRFYVGRFWTGLLWLLTLGLLGIGQLFDLFFLGAMVRDYNLLSATRFAGMGVSTNNNTVAPVINIQIGSPASAENPPRG
jgi:TM2 domain-containing membrane protein YozV